MTIKIVRLNASNTRLLDNIAEDVFHEPINPDRVAALIAHPNHILLLAASEAMVVGQLLAMIHNYPDKRPELYVDDLAVSPSSQRQSIATQLLGAAFAIGRQSGCEEIWIACNPDNDAAKGLYTSLGLRVESAFIFDGAT